MKLSAPPPPPPPPEQPAPGEQPNANAPASGVTPEAPPPEAPPTPPAPKLLQWPGWYSGMDAAIAALVLVFTFAMASFVARNSDLWIHLATGKRLIAGQYTPGSDPFSYSATDRVWVNHSWLADTVAYLLYGGQGKLLVAIKALFVTLAFGLVLAIRRPKFSLWPWAAVTCVAVLATAPYLNLRPQIVSMLFLAATLYLLFRMPHRPNSWRFPIAIGVLFWLWANSDPWFFIGPLALALVIVGDLIQTKVLNSPEEPPPAAAPGVEGSASAPAAVEEPLGWLPDTLTLVKALAIGVLACMLNPHHFRVWELPLELTGIPGVEADPRLRALTYSPLDGDYYRNAGLGQNVNGVAYAVLFVAGAAVLGFGYGRIRVAHIALWLGFAALSLRSIFAIPFFVIVAVPLVGAQLNALSSQVELKTWGDPRSRLLLIGSSLGRILCLVGVIAICVLAYPGWLHPDPGNPAYARRVGWGVEADPALQQAAEQFQRWRESGQLPPEAHGMIANTDLANYVAWFAPQEKVFVNSRYRHHRHELPDYVAVRKGLGLIGAKDDRPSPQEATDVLKKVDAEYVAIYAGPADPLYLRARNLDVTSRMYQDSQMWSPWYLDGRTVVCGWHPAGATAKPSFAALRVDPVRLAFGPGLTPLPDPELQQPPPPLSWEEAFVRPLKPTPVGGSEAIGWLQYREGPALRQLRRQVIRERVTGPLFGAVPWLGNPSMHQLAMFLAQANGVLRFAPNENTDPAAARDAAAIQAVPILALRAARRAIAENPDHPEPYFALANVLQDPDLPLSDGERALGIVTAYHQCLERMPPPERYKRGQFLLADPADVAQQLANSYLGQAIPGGIDPKTRQETIRGFVGMPIDLAPLNDLLGQGVLATPRGELVRVPFAELRRGVIQVPQSFRLLTGSTPYFLSLDAARAALKKAHAYATADQTGELNEAQRKRVEGIEKLLKEVEGALVRANEPYTQAKSRGAKLPELVETVRRNGLSEEALKLLSDKDVNLAKEYGDSEAGAVILRISLELGLGHVENASELLTAIATPQQATFLDRAGLTPLVQRLKYQKCLHAGEYKAAGEVWEALAGRGIGAFNKLPPAGPTVPRELLLDAVGGLLGFRTLQEAEKPLAILLAPPVVPQTALTQTLFWLDEWNSVRELIRQRIIDQLRNEAHFFYRRGLLSLLEGDIPAAKQRFEQSTRKAPAGWNLADVVHTDAQRYLLLIEMAAKPAP